MNNQKIIILRRIKNDIHIKSEYSGFTYGL